jgi:mannan endo-1,4-beta-mannosidase
VKSGLASDQVWQFGPSGTAADRLAFGDGNSIYYDHPEFQLLGKQHAQNMLKKKR